jgi:hypothetical protein
MKEKEILKDGMDYALLNSVTDLCASVSVLIKISYTKCH